MANTSKGRGWQYDQSTGRLNMLFNGDPSAYIDGTGLVVPATETLTVGGTLTTTGSIDLSASTVTLPTRTAFFDCMDALLGADGAVLGISETAGDFYRFLGTNQIFIKGEATVNETELSEGYFHFILPENYVSGGTITLRAVVDVEVAGDAVLNAASVVDFSAFKQSETDGSVGADLVTTAATAVTATAGNKDFTVTPTGLVAGDVLIVKLSTSIVEDAGGTGAATAWIYKLGTIVQVNK